VTVPAELRISFTCSSVRSRAEKVSQSTTNKIGKKRQTYCMGYFPGTHSSPTYLAPLSWMGLAAE
jgi:hypothetical protein